MQHTMKRWRAGATALSVAKRAFAVAIITVILAGGSVVADDLMVQIKDLPLKDVVLMLAKQSNTNLVIADESKLEKRVTASLSGVPLDKALDYVLKSAGVPYKKAEDGTYIIGGYPMDDLILPKNEVQLPPVEFASVAPPKERTFTTIKLVHSKASDLLRVLGWDGANPVRGADSIMPWRVDPAGQSAAKSMNNVSFDGNQNYRTYTFDNGMRIDTTNPSVAPTVDPASLNYGAGRTADEKTGAAQYPGAGTPGYIPGSRPGIPQPGGGITPATPQSGSSGSGNFLWPDGVDDARPFDLDNSIIVKGDPDGIEQFKKIVRMLDVPPKQVLIKAEFVEVSTNDIKRFGIDWSLDRATETFGTTFGPVGKVMLGLNTGNLNAVLRTELTTKIGRVINAPIISTINNQNAYISINREIPYWIPIVTAIGDGNVITQNQPQFQFIDTALDVLPRVNGDGTITMILRPQVSDQGSPVKGPGDQVINERRNQQLFTQRRVANGETIVVGGFIRKNESTNVTKIPILGDLPIVGSLFRSTDKQAEDSELLIFITPTVIPEMGGGTVGDSLLMP